MFTQFDCFRWMDMGFGLSIPLALPLTRVTKVLSQNSSPFYCQMVEVLEKFIHGVTPQLHMLCF